MTQTQPQFDGPAEIAEDGDYLLDKRAVASILEAVDRGDHGALSALMDRLHAADIADLLEQIRPHDREALIALYGREFDGES